MRRYFSLVLVLTLTFSGCASIKPSYRPWTRGEKAAAAYFIAGHLADAYTTERHQDYPDRFIEMNPILGCHPRDSEVIAYFSLTGAATLALTHFYPKLRYPLLLGYGSLGFYWGYHNKRLIEGR